MDKVIFRNKQMHHPVSNYISAIFIIFFTNIMLLKNIEAANFNVLNYIYTGFTIFLAIILEKISHKAKYDQLPLMRKKIENLSLLHILTALALNGISYTFLQNMETQSVSNIISNIVCQIIIVSIFGIINAALYVTTSEIIMNESNEAKSQNKY